jgi:hypothetical protein
VGSLQSAHPWNAKDRQSTGVEAVEAILDGISCRSRSNRCARYFPAILALESNGNVAQSDTQNTCVLVATQSAIQRLTTELLLTWLSAIRPS